VQSAEKRAEMWATISQLLALAEEKIIEAEAHARSAGMATVGNKYRRLASAVYDAKCDARTFRLSNEIDFQKGHHDS
jgi:hypothetical protein